VTPVETEGVEFTESSASARLIQWFSRHLQLDWASRTWNQDRLNAPEVGVTLPGRLAIKYPSAPFLWQWFWVFPAGNHCTATTP